MGGTAFGSLRGGSVKFVFVSRVGKAWTVVCRRISHMTVLCCWDSGSRAAICLKLVGVLVVFVVAMIGDIGDGSGRCGSGTKRKLSKCLSGLIS